MLTGNRFWTLAVVLGLCVLATAGCRRKSSDGTTINQSGIFTTDDFPGASVQEGNVSDDKRAFSISGDSYNGGTLVCTHNGTTGTIMVTYRVDEQLFAHYYDGSTWTPPVALRHFDTHGWSVPADEVVHAFINTDGDDRADAADRAGDCLIIWAAQDFDSDGFLFDQENVALYASYFDVSHSSEMTLNYGFDIDPLSPGFFEARRLSSEETSGEDVILQGLVTDGICGEARWRDGENEYSYGDATTGITVFWHQKVDKDVFDWDDTTYYVTYDLDSGIDEEIPLVASLDDELNPILFGADDSGLGITARESVVWTEYATYNSFLFRRVRTNGSAALGNGDFGVLDDGYAFVTMDTTDEDVTMQYSHFDLLGATSVFTSWVNSFAPDSDGVDTTESNVDYVINTNSPDFIESTGQSLYGRDEGLSCLVMYSNEEFDSDNTLGGGIWFGEEAENEMILTQMNEDTGAFVTVNYLRGDDITYSGDGADSYGESTRISRNGDYIWAVWTQIDQVGSSDTYELYGAQYQTTRVDSDGLPVPLLPTASSVGTSRYISDDVVDNQEPDWYMWQDNLGYVCGHQSDAAEMNIVFATYNSTGTDDLLYWVTLTADVDGAVGGETASPPSLIWTEDVSGFHVGSGDYGVNEWRSTFNFTDAGQDGDLLCVITYDDNDVSFGNSDVFIAAFRLGVTSASAIDIGSGVFNRQAQYNGDPLALVATPPGSTISGWDVDSAAYNGDAHFGPSFIHVIFREAETTSYPFTGGAGNTETGYALRTRQYDTDLGGGSFGDDFTPTAGATFAVPFDLDLPFNDPDTSDDAEVEAILVCDNRVAVLFTENEHLYYQECNPGNDSVGWRVVEEGVSDPALVDDDTDIQIDFIAEICEASCTCCNLSGTAIFWVKELDASNNDRRLQVRVLGSDN